MSPKKKVEEAACPVCGKMVGLDVPSCPVCGAEFEEDEVVAPQPEEDGADCPVCGRLVSLEVTVCPHCHAEFEEHEAPGEAAEAVEEETAACPVCGKMVSLLVSACPNCGAEFEEEEVEEIIEVEEAETEFTYGITTSIIDMRVLGIALALLGIIGIQIALLIDWYWTWVPPIEDNLALFAAVPVVVLVIGLLVFMLAKKAVSSGKEVSENVPSMSLTLFVFGIFALIVMLLWNPINSALQGSSVGVAVGFLVVLVVGIALVFMDMRVADTRSAA